jgi:two-component system response regulator AtoC
MRTKRVLVIDDEENMLHMLKTILTKEGYEIDLARDGREGLIKVASSKFDIVLCDLRMPEMDGMDFLNGLKEKKMHQTIIMMSAYGTIDCALEAMKRGAYDYISKPFKPDEIILTLKKAEERENLKEENSLLKSKINNESLLEPIVAQDDIMLGIFETIRKIAGYNTSVLITGESGTGKELIARAIHKNSNRATQPFVAINCGAIPENLLESELFGYLKGAFTDAYTNKKGLFEEAQGGTIFLDEIAELPMNLQVKLLRVLQEGEMRKIGDTKQIKLDVRIIAATAKDLVEQVKRDRFREDLFYRLNVIQISIPPLRKRRGDIPLLIQYFIERYNEKHRLKVKGISATALQLLLENDWPGNVRELENVIERAVVLTAENKIELTALPVEIGGGISGANAGGSGNEYSLKKMSRIMEEQLIRKALTKTRGNRTHAAKLLEISHPALLSKMKAFGLQ